MEIIELKIVYALELDKNLETYATAQLYKNLKKSRLFDGFSRWNYYFLSLSYLFLAFATGEH